MPIPGTGDPIQSKAGRWLDGSNWSSYPLSVTDDRIHRQGEMLSNRVQKNVRHLRKWVRRTDVSCYRIYDRDIPELPLVIDWYEGRLHVAQFGELDEAQLRALLAPALEALEAPASQVYFKARQRQKGTQQYQNRGDTENRFEVGEGGHRFWINLSDYLDTGLFLDHRKTRAMVQAEAEDRRVLNLFCYTGAFSVYAAAGGARDTLGVDLSGTYLDWARANLELNGFSRDRHRLRRGDVMAVLGELNDEGERFELAVVDPPTFSNSKSMEGTFDVLRDHEELLRRVADVMVADGLVYFSTNHRHFRWEGDALEDVFASEEITSKTIPEDFRDRKIHRCFRLVRR